MRLSTPMMRWIVAPRVNTETGDEFGAAVALSADGGTLAVGAAGEDSSAATGATSRLPTPAPHTSIEVELVGAPGARGRRDCSFATPAPFSRVASTVAATPGLD